MTFGVVCSYSLKETKCKFFLYLLICYFIMCSVLEAVNGVLILVSSWFDSFISGTDFDFSCMAIPDGLIVISDHWQTTTSLHFTS